ncbi:putative WRKY transcription factor 62 [Dorcoceras hygrometricum]|uniref:Putative WRKY transcription factor 62 n=1 Tax=Dorcoceras hygrometricum TaxID=472368 RepID=A0A2Z7AFF8_9LAMI|nr:putative WRKY transcription factor 62 [Dorcoceras hygrometricum]
MTFRVVRTNQYNQDLGLIHSTNGNHLESLNEGSSIDHHVTIYLHAQNITMFPTNETWYFASQILFPCGNLESSTCVTLNGSGIQLAVGPQPLWLRNHNFGLAQRIMVKRLATSPHDPLGITDSACKNQLVMVSVQYDPFSPYIPIRSTTIGKSRVAKDPIAMHTSWRSNSDITSVTRVSMTFRVVRTNQYNQDLGLIHSTNGNHLKSPNEALTLLFTTADSFSFLLNDDVTADSSMYADVITDVSRFLSISNADVNVAAPLTLLFTTADSFSFLLNDDVTANSSENWSLQVDALAMLHRRDHLLVFAFVLPYPATNARDLPAGPPPGPDGSNETNHGPNHGLTREN